MTGLRLKWCITLLYLVLSSSVWVDAREVVEDMGIMQQDEEILEWFRDAKFGMFLHWELYAVEAKGEWVMDKAGVTIEDYRRYAFDLGDGAWLTYKPSDREAAFFWEPGKYRDPNNAWPVDSVYADFDDKTGKPLGLMGIARKYSQNMVCNNRSGWMGDYYVNEGGNEVTGPILSEVWEKNLNLNETAWGYTTEQNLMSYERLIGLFVNCLVRNGNFLLNFGPDRHGNLPPSHVARLCEMGAWLKIVGDSVYGTRGGPWHPKDRQYGFTMKGKKVYIHILPEYLGTSFVTDPLPCTVLTCTDLYTGKALTFKQTQEGKVEINGIDREAHPADTIIAMTLDKAPPKPKHIHVPRFVIENKG